MRIKLDENLPSALSNLLEEFGHDADTVVDEEMVGSGDEELWRAVQVAGRFFITQGFGLFRCSEVSRRKSLRHFSAPTR